MTKLMCLAAGHQKGEEGDCYPFSVGVGEWRGGGEVEVVLVVVAVQLKRYWTTNPPHQSTCAAMWFSLSLP